jgi:hypothetical protein
MSIHDETWDKCRFCKQTIKSFHGYYHDNGNCLKYKSWHDYNKKFHLEYIPIAVKPDALNDREVLDFFKHIYKVDISDLIYYSEEHGFSVNCNDMFGGGSDAENIKNVKDIELLKECGKKCEAVGQGWGAIYGPLLYCCYKRNLRLWERKLQNIDPEIRPLFEKFEK